MQLNNVLLSARRFPAILLFTFICSRSSASGLQITECGVIPPKRDDVGLALYMTAHNTENGSFHIVTKMVKCCAIISYNDTDCKFMKIMGGDMGELLYDEKKNLTLIYPNLYLHDRVGECLVDIWYKSNTSNTIKKKRQQIRFDTKISLDKVPLVLKDYYTLEEAEQCDSVDLDPLDDCEPVNCEVKYSGSRSYFNWKLRRCQKVPTCIADETKELPDVAYNPNTNMCKDMETPISERDLQLINRGMYRGLVQNAPCPPFRLFTIGLLIQLSLLFWSTWTAAAPAYRHYAVPSYSHRVYPVYRHHPSQNIRCHHGQMDNTTGFCVCDKGWSTAPNHHYSPGTSVYHMCTVQIGHWTSVENKQDHKIYWIIAAIVLALLYALSAALCYKFCYKKHFESMSEEEICTCPMEDTPLYNGSDCGCHEEDE